jgi:riboflavin kinase/FMN adenylyltransferase
VWITSSLATAKTPTRVALGNFDGVHLGHRQVIEPVLLPEMHVSEQVLEFAKTVPDCLQSSLIASGHSHWPAVGNAPESVNSPVLSPGHPGATAELATVVTFFPHPQEFFSGQSRPLLTTLEEKTWQLAHLGIDQLVLLPFNQALAELSAEAFVEQILIQGLRATHISVGSDFRFGKGRQGDVALLDAIASHHHIPITIVPLKLDHSERISSSRIRQALQTGHVQEANQLLGRPYTLTGRVVQGQQLGRTLGFPTANLKLPPDKFIPCQGVYSVRVCGVTDDNTATPHLGVMNIGTRPTVEGQNLSVEVHIFDWSGDLYNRMLTIRLESFLRPEQKFSSLDSLKAQIQADCEAAMTALAQ